MNLRIHSFRLRHLHNSLWSYTMTFPWCLTGPSSLLICAAQPSPAVLGYHCPAEEPGPQCCAPHRAIFHFSGRRGNLCRLPLPVPPPTRACSLAAGPGLGPMRLQGLQILPPNDSASSYSLPALLCSFCVSPAGEGREAMEVVLRSFYGSGLKVASIPACSHIGLSRPWLLATTACHGD